MLEKHEWFRKLRDLFVAVKSDSCVVASCMEVFSSSVGGDADTIKLLFLFKGQLRHLF